MKKIIIIGNGVMGSIFAKALENNFTVQILEREDNKSVCKDADVVFVAVKPQSFADLAGELKGNLGSAVVVSIMAGVSVEKIKLLLNCEKVVRSMPNLGARIGKSMTVWTASNAVDEKEKQLVKDFFLACGEELEVKDESLINSATAVSGSGPGFFFYLIEQWVEAASKFGFTKEEVMKMILATVNASNILLQQDKDPKKLREQVTSKGGTTEAGLKVMEKFELEKMFSEVLAAAKNRAEELSN